MKIGIVGAGNIGSALAEALEDTDHEVRIANSRGPDTLTDLAERTGATPTTVDEVTDGADLVVITIPMGRTPDLPDDLLDGAADDVVVLDTNNYYPGRDGKIAEIEDGKTESRWVSDQIGHDVVKAFNGIYARDIAGTASPSGTPDRRALPVAGDDERAKRVVMDLVDQIGFEPYDAGSIDESWRQQPGSPHYTHAVDTEGLKKALADASPERSDDWRA
jgi:8-hydroxy-5-deazaflavin:NADPH oxidoreductase